MRDHFQSTVPQLFNILVIKKGPSHGTRHGSTERQIIHYAAHNAARKARKEEYTSTLDRFLNNPRYRKSQTAIGWDEEFCAHHAIAAEHHSEIATQGERSRNENSWKVVLNTSGKNGPMDQRDDYQEAKRTKKRDCMKSVETATPDSTPRIKFDDDEVNNLLGPKSSPACRPQNGLEMVRPSINKLFILKLASNFMVEIFIME